MGLTLLLHLGDMADFDSVRWHALLSDGRAAGVGVTLEDRGEFALGHLAQSLADGLHEVLSHLGHLAAHRAKNPWGVRDQDLWDAELCGELYRVERSGPAEAEKSEVTRIESSLERDQPRRGRHIVIDDAHPFLKIVHVDIAFDAGEAGTRQTPKQHVRIGHGGFGTAASIRDRSR